jgi:hypothetical protein
MPIGAVGTNQTTEPDGTACEEKSMTTALSDEAAMTLALVASEWFKTARRLARLVNEGPSGRVERERAQLAYSRNRIETLLAQSGLRMVTHDGISYTSQLPPEPMNPEDFETDEGLIVKKTLEPTVIYDGRVIVRGQVVLGKVE